MHVFNQTALEVCEGQQYDMDFESEAQVSEDVLFGDDSFENVCFGGCSSQDGSVIAEAPEEQLKNLRFWIELGHCLSIARRLFRRFWRSQNFWKASGRRHHRK